MKTTRLLLLASALLGGAVACHRGSTAKTDAAAAPQASTAPAVAAEKSASGVVLETMDASSYTYVRIKSDKGDIWAAGPQTAVAVGEKVSFPLDLPMDNFRSATLNRTFPTIYFTSRIVKEGQATAPAGH